jgi:hypothetical protein
MLTVRMLAIMNCFPELADDVPTIHCSFLMAAVAALWKTIGDLN